MRVYLRSDGTYRIRTGAGHDILNKIFCLLHMKSDIAWADLNLEKKYVCLHSLRGQEPMPPRSQKEK